MGAKAIMMRDGPDVGNQYSIDAGAVVTKNVPPLTIVAGLTAVKIADRV
jgi:serine acetyltransferase